MGVILQGILGGFSGKVGPVVGGKWKDVDYMRSYVVPANPNTAGQQTVRTKFAQLVAYARDLLSTILQTYWDPFESSMSGFNAWISANYSLVDGSNLLTANSIMARGTLEPCAIVTATYNTSDGSLNVSWSDEINGNGDGLDDIKVVLFNKLTKELSIPMSGDTRVSTGDSGTIATGLTATNLILYIFATRGTGSEFVVSDSDGQVCAAP
jgi:hypothetical protein